MTEKTRDDLILAIGDAVMSILVRVENGNLAVFDEIEDTRMLTKIQATRVFNRLSTALKNATEQIETPSPLFMDEKTKKFMRGSVDLQYHTDIAEDVFELFKDNKDIRFDFLCHLLEKIKRREQDKRDNEKFHSVGNIK